MNYKIEIRNIEAMRTAYMSYHGIPKEANTFFPRIFKSIQGKTNGAPFFHYLHVDLETMVSDIELCVPTMETPNKKEVGIKKFPNIKALCITHFGSYETISHAYQAIVAYAKSHQIPLYDNYREVYIKGPGMLLKGNPAKYITEILFPIKEDC